MSERKYHALFYEHPDAVPTDTGPWIDADNPELWKGHGLDRETAEAAINQAKKWCKDGYNKRTRVIVVDEFGDEEILWDSPEGYPKPESEDAVIYERISGHDLQIGDVYTHSPRPGRGQYQVTALDYKGKQESVECAPFTDGKPGVAKLHTSKGSDNIYLVSRGDDWENDPDGPREGESLSEFLARKAE